MSGTHFLKTTWLRAQGASEARFADLTWIIELNSRPPKIGRRWSLMLGHSSATTFSSSSVLKPLSRMGRHLFANFRPVGSVANRPCIADLKLRRDSGIFFGRAATCLAWASSINMRSSSCRLSVWLTTAATTGGGTGDWTTGCSRTTCHQNRMSQHGIASNVPWWEPWGTARGKCMSGGLL